MKTESKKWQTKTLNLGKSRPKMHFYLHLQSRQSVSILHSGHFSTILLQNSLEFWISRAFSNSYLNTYFRQNGSQKTTVQSWPPLCNSQWPMWWSTSFSKAEPEAVMIRKSSESVVNNQVDWLFWVQKGSQVTLQISDLIKACFFKATKEFVNVKVVHRSRLESRWTPCGQKIAFFKSKLTHLGLDCMKHKCHTRKAYIITLAHQVLSHLIN